MWTMCRLSAILLHSTSIAYRGGRPLCDVTTLARVRLFSCKSGTSVAQPDESPQSVTATPPTPPLRPYLQFLCDQFQQCSRSKNAYLLKAKWMMLPDAERQAYLDRYVAAYRTFVLERKKYNQQGHAKQREVISRTTNSPKLAQRRTFRKLFAELGGPRKPIRNPFSLFFKELAHQHPDKNITATALLKLASARWKSLTDMEKDLYRQRCSENSEAYQEELTRWWEKLTESERTDLVNAWMNYSMFLKKQGRPFNHPAAELVETFGLVEAKRIHERLAALNSVRHRRCEFQFAPLRLAPKSTA